MSIYCDEKCVDLALAETLSVHEHECLVDCNWSPFERRCRRSGSQSNVDVGNAYGHCSNAVGPVCQLKNGRVVLALFRPSSR